MIFSSNPGCLFQFPTREVAEELRIFLSVHFYNLYLLKHSFFFLLKKRRQNQTNIAGLVST